MACAVFGFLGFSVFMGVFYGQAKLCQGYGSHSGTVKNMALAFAAPAFFHGFYGAGP